MAINPVTGKEQVYPDERDVDEFNKYDNPGETEREGKEFVRGLADKYFSFLFAAMETKKIYDNFSFEQRVNQEKTFDAVLVDVSQGSPRFSVWLSELLQNAIDARWGNGIGATDISISFNESEIIFQHNGRPPQYLGFSSNEFLKLIERGTTKKTSLKNEGKFGIGFKFWRYFFEEVSLECENWQINWNSKNQLSKIMKSDVNSGLRMVFSIPKKEYSQKFTDYQGSFQELFDEDLERLIEGIAVQTTPLSISISLEGEQKIKLIHEAEEKEYSILDEKIRYYEIQNELISENLEFNWYIPKKLIGYDSNKFHNIEQFKSIKNLANCLEEEFRIKGRSNAFTRDLLEEEYKQGHKEDTELPEEEEKLFDLLMSDENLKNASLSHRKDIQTLCLFDISPEMSKHFMMYSLFSLSQKIGIYNNTIWKNKKESRISYIGTYTINQERTRLEPSNRNKAIVDAQLDSTYLLLNLISNEGFREENDIYDSIHLEILKSLEEEKFDREFMNLANELRDSK